mmetsp:Transcript_37911/g.77361  ORF Transcript_37911/g.77361 Transcript_37911/m.77361 type:complete len:370 (+) Transcript_37911:425-1534(+)
MRGRGGSNLGPGESKGGGGIGGGTLEGGDGVDVRRDGKELLQLLRRRVGSALERLSDLRPVVVVVRRRGGRGKGRDAARSPRNVAYARVVQVDRPQPIRGPLRHGVRLGRLRLVPRPVLARPEPRGPLGVGRHRQRRAVQPVRAIPACVLHGRPRRRPLRHPHDLGAQEDDTGHEVQLPRVESHGTHELRGRERGPLLLRLRRAEARPPPEDIQGTRRRRAFRVVVPDRTGVRVRVVRQDRAHIPHQGQRLAGHVPPQEDAEGVHRQLLGRRPVHHQRERRLQPQGLEGQGVRKDRPGHGEGGEGRGVPPGSGEEVPAPAGGEEDTQAEEGTQACQEDYGAGAPAEGERKEEAREQGETLQRGDSEARC